MTAPVDEVDLPGHFLPMRWTFVLMFSMAGLLTEWWPIYILAVVVGLIAVWEDFEDSDINWNFGSKREEI